MNDQSLTASKDVVTRTVGGELVLLHLHSGLYFGLNEVGAFVWDQLSIAPKSQSQLSDAIAAQFDAPRAEIEADLASLVEEMLAKKLISAKSA